ncbi:MAG: hypothetical protein V1495_04100 [Pseudomonadota bacterium]
MPKTRASLLLLLLPAAGLLVHGISLPNPFYFDDLFVLRDNGWIFGKTPWIWLTNYFIDQNHLFTGFRPGLMITFWLNQLLVGPSPESFRTVNLAIHIGNSFLLFLWLRRVLSPTGRLIPIAAALLFLVHPIQTFPINFIWKRSTLLETTLLLSSLILQARERGRPTYRIRVVLLQTAIFLAALSIKESALLFPAILAAADLFVHRKRSTLLYLPLLLIAVGFYWFRFIEINRWLGEHRRIIPSPHSLSRAEYIWTSLQTLPRYFLQWPLPDPRILDDPSPLRAIPWNAVTIDVFLLALSVLVSIRWRKIGLVPFSIALFWIQIVPTMVFPLYLVMDTIRLYVPLLGLSFLMTFFLLRLVDWIRTRRKFIPSWAGAAILGGLFLSYAAHSVLQNLRYRDPISIWQDVAIEYPESDLAWGELGIALSDAGEHGKAAVAFGMATRINPSNLGYTILTLHNALRSGTSPEVVKTWLRNFSTVDVSIPDIVNLGNLARQLGEPALAKEIYLEALRKNGNYGPAYLYLASLFEVTGETEKAKRAHENAARFMPYSREAKEGARRNLFRPDAP